MFEKYNKLTVVKLKELLRENGLIVSGKKADLVNRLMTHLIENMEQQSETKPQIESDISETEEAENTRVDEGGSDEDGGVGGKVRSNTYDASLDEDEGDISDDIKSPETGYYETRIPSPDSMKKRRTSFNSSVTTKKINSSKKDQRVEDESSDDNDNVDEDEETRLSLSDGDNGESSVSSPLGSGAWGGGAISYKSPHTPKTSSSITKPHNSSKMKTTPGSLSKGTPKRNPLGTISNKKEPPSSDVSKFSKKISTPNKYEVAEVTSTELLSPPVAREDTVTHSWRSSPSSPSISSDMVSPHTKKVKKKPSPLSTKKKPTTRNIDKSMSRLFRGGNDECSEDDSGSSIDDFIADSDSDEESYESEPSFMGGEDEEESEREKDEEDVDDDGDDNEDDDDDDVDTKVRGARVSLSSSFEHSREDVEGSDGSLQSLCDTDEN
jgi:hypothetical protein